MKIELAKIERMSQTGSSLLRLMQNNHMPILDLFIRESIQNSSDAAKDGTDHVKIDLISGEFNSLELSKEFEGAEDRLNERFKGVQKYIAIRDSNTTGLTGPMDYSEVKNNDYGNLLKLVYEISKQQTKEGSGGSWGLGKTIYFRMGIGLVIYYSRIKKENEEFQERLAACLVEDETNEESILYDKNNLRRGIAWWGEERNDRTIPITDTNEIHNILEVFGLNPYLNDETGTTIIVPYINEKELLENNIIYNDNKPYWYRDIENYFRIAIQRWYAPRIDNYQYDLGKALDVRINGKKISKGDMDPVFKIIQNLYLKSRNKLLDIDLDIKYKPINIKLQSKMKRVGTMSYVKLKNKDLKMLPPDNNPNPYKYLNLDVDNNEENRPVVAFIRKPGMIVSYEIDGKWNSILSTEKSEYIICLFVLDSNQIINSDRKLLLEEYIRQSEKADHTSWSDHTIIDGANLRIVSRIQRNVQEHIKKEYNLQASIKRKTYDSGLSNLFGRALLPIKGFGTKAGYTPKGNNRKTVSKNKKYKFNLITEGISYEKDYIKIPFTYECNKANEHNVLLKVVTESGNILLKNWKEEIGGKIPFILEGIKINNTYLNNHKRNYEDLEKYKVLLDYNILEDEFDGFKIKVINKCKIEGTMIIKVIDKISKLSIDIME